MSVMELHFLRPVWLLAIPAAMLVVWFVWGLNDARSAWRGVIAPDLLDALLVRADRRKRLIPVHLLGVAAVLIPLALSGPSWRLEESPFAEETAAIVVVVEASRTMNTEDVQPTRLERGAQKISDLLERRPDMDAALIAYAGSAHLAMPITSSGSVVAEFAAALSPQVMPVDGDAASDAIELAQTQLRRAGAAGSILLVTDGVDEGQAERIAALDTAPIHVLSVTLSTPGDTLAMIADDSGGSVTRVTVDGQDVDRLASRVRRDIGRAGSLDETRARRDEGYWLTPLVAIVVLSWSRRGWAVRYSGRVSD